MRSDCTYVLADRVLHSLQNTSTVTDGKRWVSMACKINLPDQTAKSLPDHTAQSLPDQTAQSLPDQTAQSLPDQTAHSLPDQTAQNM